jgi:hypothetical protein
MEQYKYDDTMKFRFTKNDNNEYNSFDDKPSCEYLDGSIISWHKNGLLHRINKPALIRILINGEILEEYYHYGKLYIPNINIQSFINDNNFIKYKEGSLNIFEGTKDELYDENRYNFNKEMYVPEILCNYIGIKSNEKKSRPQVTKLLNEKFKETGLMKLIIDENNKEIKVVVLDKITCKILNLEEGYVFRNKDIQQFISQFYKEARMGEFIPK